MDELLERLRKFDALRDVVTEGRGDAVLIRVLPARPPAFAPAAYMDRLPSAVRTALAGLGVGALYAHQAEAIDRIRAGEDVVLEAPTASGKTLSFIIPIALRLLEKPDAHALVVHPMKALSNDQRRELLEFTERRRARARAAWNRGSSTGTSTRSTAGSSRHSRRRCSSPTPRCST